MPVKPRARARAAAALTMLAAVLVTTFGLAPQAGAEDIVTLTDDTGMFAIDVPAAWADVTTEPLEYEDETLVPNLAASTDFLAFPAAAEGMQVLVLRGPLDDGPTDPGSVDALESDGCTASAAPAEGSLPALSRALIGTYACGEYHEVIAYGGTADGAWIVGVTVRVTGDPARARAVVDSL